MVVPAFGFSAGDFIAAINLVNKAAKSLGEVSGATAQCRQATADLNHILSVLRTVQALDDSKVPQHVVDKVQLCSHACNIPLATFLGKLKKFDILSDVAGPHRSALKSLLRGSRKVRWALLVEEEVTKLKICLGPQLAVIEILLQLGSGERLCSIEKTASGNQKYLETVLSGIDQIRGCLTNEVASKNDVDRLESLLGGILTQQDHRNQSVLRSAQLSRLTTHELQAKVERLEAATHALLQKINANLTPGIFSSPPPDPRRSCFPVEPAADADTDGSQCQRHRRSLSTHAGRLWLAGRHSFVELMMLLLCMLPAVQRFFRSLLTLARSPSLLLDSNINLEDALGRTLSLPFEHFRFWPVMEMRLREAFSGCPGQDKVLRREFHIVNLQDNGNSVLTAEVWAKVVRPGSRLAMSILYQKTGAQGRTCPGCSYASAVAHSDSWIQCLSCGLTYRTLERMRLRMVAQISRRARHKSTMEGSEFAYPVPFSGSEQDESETNQIRHFKRIHILSQPAHLDHWCHICNAGFYSALGLSHHMRVHTPYEHRQYVCDLCDERFLFTKDLNRHRLVHAPKTIFCPHSGCSLKAFSRQDNLLRHLRLKHSTDSDVQPETTPSSALGLVSGESSDLSQQEQTVIAVAQLEKQSTESTAPSDDKERNGRTPTESTAEVDTVKSSMDGNGWALNQPGVI